MNEYDAQAQEFLDSTKTIFKTEYKGHYKYFDTDEHTRDVYDVTLTNPRGSYTFTFGQSLNFSDWSKYSDEQISKIFFSPHRPATIYQVEQFRKKNQQDFKAGKFTPRPYDVLASFDVWTGTFEDFCSDFGYESKKTWRAVLEQSFQLQKLFSEEELERLAEIN